MPWTYTRQINGGYVLSDGRQTIGFALVDVDHPIVVLDTLVAALNACETAEMVVDPDTLRLAPKVAS